MVVIGFTVLGVGLVVGLLLALADPVLLSRVNGEHAEGGSGRHVEVPPVTAAPERGQRATAPERGQRATAPEPGRRTMGRPRAA
ncbi:hypothetical protein [Nonomuraea lactucae]|uniref:hypothetical protein n=1 Tax=Nonomuraea lactucae TaxID=2249762 RepID=UPI0013B429F2|nr:hypothetical protein [Nonomuraea lactucae]